MGTDLSYRIERCEAENHWTRVILSDEDVYTLDGWLCNRDYGLYAILAGVKLRGKHWCKPVVPVRGFPGKGQHMETPDCHNATWMTVAELDSFPWDDRTIKMTAYLDAESYMEYVVEGTTLHWWRTDRGCQVVTEKEMEQLINANHSTQNLVTKVNLHISYATFADPFLEYVLPILRRLGPPDSVRLILSFDS